MDSVSGTRHAGFHDVDARLERTLDSRSVKRQEVTITSGGRMPTWLVSVALSSEERDRACQEILAAVANRGQFRLEFLG